MTYVRYVSFVNNTVFDVGCMKCGRFIYNLQDAMTIKRLRDTPWAHKAKVDLSDGSYTDVLLCDRCKVTDADLPQLERTMKWAWLVEFIKAGRPREEILQLAKRVKILKMLRTRE